MKKAFQKSLLVAAVSATLATASFAMEIGSTNLLFPFVTTNTGAFTFITLNNGGASNVGGAHHYIYGMKATGAANSVGCEHQDGNGSLTPNDVMQFDITGVTKIETAAYLNNGDTNNSFPYTGGAGKQGFLIVNSNGLSGDTLYGSAVIVDTSTGLRMAYATGGLSTNDATPADFTANNVGVAGGAEVANSGIVTTVGGVAGNGNHMLTWYASPQITSSWYVVPLGLETAMSPSAAIGGIAASYSMFNSAGTLGGAYDMKEAFTSGSQAASVKCTGLLTRDLMLQPGALANTAKGGWALLGQSNVTAANNLGAIADKSLVYQIQSTNVIAGTTNTFINRANHR